MLIALRNLGIIFALMMLLCALYLAATEYILAQTSRGEVLLFRRGHKPKTALHDDEEAQGMIHTQRTAQLATEKSQADEEMSSKMETYGANFLWDRLSYRIKTKDGSRALLDDIEGWVKAGTLTALMVRFRTPLQLVP